MLNREEIARTAAEHHANLDLSGLTLDEVAVDLDFTPARLRSALDLVEVHDPADVWLLRDYLEQAVSDAGREPVPYTVLTEASRRRARGWFHLRPAPRHSFSQR